ncbi:hypothetical protein TeGR_g5963 [Tetraparma gracilis]|uniref:AB hydrolase-1 domain-containing protein n=1 Tax=Tetraparma gracilis TaxID=2962635 RepID=A0ABQ6MEN5_9STRA|nr:hypothetical protein TeGR_g5963 [Tetraparma gracilis]
MHLAPVYTLATMLLLSLPLRRAFPLPSLPAACPSREAALRELSARTGWLHDEPSSSSSSSSSSAPSPSPPLAHSLSSPAVVHRLQASRLLVTEHSFSLPLRPSSPETLTVHATVADLLSPGASSSAVLAYLNHDVGRDAVAAAAAYSSLFASKAGRSLLFLQGGPGFPSPRPGASLSFSDSWASAALAAGFAQVVLLDQRGTGRSSPVTRQALELRLGPAGGWGTGEVGEAVAFLSAFRADAIVKDSESVRAALCPGRRWGAVLGQSFGGFALAALLADPGVPDPEVALFTGGLPPVHLSEGGDVEGVYERLWERVREKNEKYYAQYPGDVPVVKKIVRALLSSPPPLPSGGTLTARRFLQLGLCLGGGPGSFEGLHELLAGAFIQDKSGADVLSVNFLRAVERQQPFDTNPLYFLLHESIYCSCPGESSGWAAHRSLRARGDGLFDYEENAKEEGGRPVLFFGEMVFPWMVEDYAELGGKGMRELAEGLAGKSDWPPLYGGGGGGPVRGAAAVYENDMYVEKSESMRLVAKGALLEGVEAWVTSDFEHSGLRDDGVAIFEKLYGLAKD